MATKKQIVLSGTQPTGELHIGNYLGALKNWVGLQDKYQCYFFLATYHSITANYQAKEKKQQIMDLTIDYIAAGLDPKKCIIFNQADVPACTELAWIFNTLTPIAELERMTQFKDKSQKQATNINVGLFDYPVLQAADILLYQPNYVPVGQDQLQHLELTNKIVRWFNNKYGQYFQEIKPLLTETPKIMSLVEPEKKMSKSCGPKHYIAINDSPQVIEEKIKKAVTGTGTEKQIPTGAKNLLALLAEFGTDDEVIYFSKQISQKNIKYGELKQTLAKAISQYFEPYRTKRKELEQKSEYINKVLAEGAAKAQKVAKQTLIEVKKQIGVA